MNQAGKILIIAGIVIIILGIVFYFGGSRFNWIGRLPGDIRIEKENFKLFIPITTMLLFSIMLTLIMWIFNKFF